MSDSAVRKLQPFTVGTRLSLPKCAEVDPGMATLDNGSLLPNLNDRVSLYLARAQVGSGQPRSATAGGGAPRRDSPTDAITEEDRINRNALAARAIRKITLSNWRGGPTGTTEGTPRVSPPGSERNLNNNNSRMTRDLPRMAGMHRENRPKAQVKVFLRKESEEVENEAGGSAQKRLCSGVTRSSPETGSPFPMDLGCSSASSPPKDDFRRQDASCGVKPGPRGYDDPQRLASLSSHIAQFNREALQAETWVRGKLRDLKDGCDPPHTPLQGWEQAALTLQRDTRDFENTLTKLSQMAEHLISKQTPNADNMIKQLQALKDQWHVLKQTAANQSKALGGARTLQEFKRKADELEAWIREKEEKRCSAVLPEDSSDKIQLARRILDLKQEQQRFRNLQEEVNGLAQKLEKQGRNESRGISARRKHLNKMWLKVQGTLADHHNTLQLALEAASFHQQADALLRAMDSKRRTVCSLGAQAEPEGPADRDVRDIASQIMMLDVTVSQLISLHPELAAGVTQKHQEVKRSWGVLQQAVREDKLTPKWRHPKEAEGLVTHMQEGPSGMGKQQLGPVPRGSCVELHNEGNEVQRGDGPSTEGPGASRDQSELSSSKVLQETGSDAINGRHSDHKRKKRAAGQTEGLKARPQPEAQLQHFCQVAAQALCWLKENMSSSAQWDRAESEENIEEMQKQQATLQQEITRQQVLIEAVQQEGKALVTLAHPGSPRVEGILRELERLWGALKRRNQHRGTVLQDVNKAHRVLDELADMDQWLQDLASSLSEPAVMRDPDVIRKDLQETSHMETELSSHGVSLHALREEIDRIPTGSRLFLAAKIQKRAEAVEERFALVKDAVRRRELDLRDSLVLSEFLQNVQMEEKLSPRNVTPAVRRRLDFREPLRLTPTKEGQKQVTVENVEEMATPLDELQEAVDMLNDAVKERERVMAAEKETGSLAHLLSEVSQRISSAQSQAEALGQDIVETERDFAAVKSEPGLEGLQELQDKQKEMECHIVESLKVVMAEVDEQVAHVEELRPSQLRALRQETQGTRAAWTKLQKTVCENKAKLEKAFRLQEFFRNYLAMISWTEDTRTQVFSGGVDADGLPMKEKEELGRKIEVKFKEFEDLAGVGLRLIAEDHCLTETIKERLEELQSMLGWVLVRWRAQKRQQVPGNKKDKKKQKESRLQEAVSKAPVVQDCHNEAATNEAVSLPHDALACSVDPPSSQRRVPANQPGSRLPWDGQAWEDLADALDQPTENSQDPPSAPTFSELGVPRSTLVLDPSETPVVVMPQPGTGSLGGTVNLILSISRKDEKKSQAQKVEGVEDAHEEDGLHRVCTYLHVKDSEKERSPVCHSLTMPRTSKKTPPKACASPLSGPHSTTGVAFHTLPKISPNSLLNSLKRKEKVKAEAQRLTVQKIMGAHTNGARSQPEANDNGMKTWPLKRHKKKSRVPSPAMEGFLDYMKNPLARDIDAECGSMRPASGFRKQEISCRTLGFVGSKTNSVSYGCRHLSLGSVLSLELPKDLSLLGNSQDIQENIRILPEGSERRSGSMRDSDVGSHRETNDLVENEEKVSGHPRQSPDFVQEMPKKVVKHGEAFANVLTHDKIQQNPGVCSADAAQAPDPDRLNKHVHTASEQDRLITLGQRDSTEDLLDFSLKRLSRISVLHEQMDHEWDQMAARMKTSSGPTGLRAEAQVSCSVKLREMLTGKMRVNSPNKSPSRAARDKPPESAGAESLIVGPVQMATSIRGYNDRQIDDSTGSAPVSQQIQVGVKPSSQLSVLQYEICHQDSDSFSHIKPSTRVDRTQSPASAENPIRVNTQSLLPTNVVHPNHELFEEDEEELEGIWKNVERYKSRQGKEVVHATWTKEAGGDSKSGKGHTDDSKASKGDNGPHSIDIPGGQVIMTSEPNMLVAQFTLPTLAHTHQRRELKDNISGNGGVPTNMHASCTSQLPREGTNQKLPNETVPTVAKDPCKKIQLTATYKSQEAERENAGASKSPARKDFQLMEGTLEKKHVLQPGGRKATCRTWMKCHAVLVRQTLCFYQDRKDPLKSSTGAVPLKLAGALCSLDTEYTKRSNCFRLQMRDGSEVLLRAPTCALMEEWVSKIQLNSGFDDEDFFQAAGRPPEGSPPPTAWAAGMTSAGRSSSVHLSGYVRPSSAPLKEMSLVTRSSARLQWSPGRQEPPAGKSSLKRDDYRSVQDAVGRRLCQWAPMGSPRLQHSAWHEDDDPALVANQRRSRSFTSATYQKVTPVSLPADTFEAGSSFSVTLYIGDQSSPVQRARRHSLASKDSSVQREQLHQPDWPTEDPAERTLGAFTPPKNKSVFKRFFRKKD
ncbi:uncharacterized protein [Pleurodeles waltl]|uniref:uncharacterized protein isoform X2 n=1 Tax=Pleurodeles waltl TaxID=8319 RepID=UPI0037095CE5